MKKLFFIGLLVFLLPTLASAQALNNEIKNFQSLLETLYNDMMPKFGMLIGIGRALAGFGATWYIAYRVWGHIARAEPIDFYPLFRPFAIGLAIMFYVPLLGVINSALKPLVTGTNQIVINTDKTIAELIKKKEAAMKESDQWKALVSETGNGDRDLWLKYAHPEIKTEGFGDKMWNSAEFMMDKMIYNFQNDMKQRLSYLLEIVYAIAVLCINTLSTFNRIILSMLGPIVLGLAVWDGFHHTLAMFLARYINYYLWLPVANILGATLGTIQENILKMDMKNLAQTGTTFFSSYDLGYIIFLGIGIVAYATIPSIADKIIHVGGSNTLINKINNLNPMGGFFRR